MSVSNAETFTLQGGSVTANSTNIITELANSGITGTYSNGVITITNANLASTSDSNIKFKRLVRIAEASGATMRYTVAT